MVPPYLFWLKSKTCCSRTDRCDLFMPRKRKQTPASSAISTVTTPVIIDHPAIVLVPTVIPPWRLAATANNPTANGGNRRARHGELKAESRSLAHQQKRLARQACCTLDTCLREALCLPAVDCLVDPTPVPLESAILFTELCINTAYDEESVDSLVSISASSEEELPQTPVADDGYLTPSDESGYVTDASCFSL